MLTRLALFVALGSTAVAQTTTTTPTTTSGSTTTGGASGLEGSSTPTSGFSGAETAGTPQINTGTTTGANVHPTNGFSQYYANPNYSGIYPGTGTPGGFGTPFSGGSASGGRASSSVTSRTTGSSGRATSGTSYGGTGTSSGLTGGSSTMGRSTSPTIGASTQQGLSGFGSTSTAGRGTTGFGQTGTSGFGQTGRTGTTGFGQTSGFGQTGRGGSQQNSSIIATQARQVSTRLTLPVAQFPRAAHPVMHAEVTSAIGRSSFLSNPGSISITHEGADVILRGAVKDEEEARTAEGIARLTPGVRSVKSELTFPNP